MGYSSTYLKMRVLGAVDSAPGKTKKERLQNVAQMIFIDENGIPRQFTWRTIQTWLWCYTKLGHISLKNKIRSDKGTLRKVSKEDVVEAVEQVLPSFRDKYPKKAHIYRACIERGLLRREDVAPNTFSRLVNNLELLNPNQDLKQRQAFSKQYANQMWQVDTMFGPYLNGAQTKLIAFIDDASRVICHGEFFTKEDTYSFLSALQSALYKRGVPEHLYTDNGSIYTCKEIILVCARLGIFLTHAPVRDGAAKGKIERFFRTVREDFLGKKHDLSSLADFNKAFTLWLEDQYNSRVHSTLQMKPIDRFGLDLKRIRFLPVCDANDEIFFVEAPRKVKADNTFSLKSIRFETPANLHGRPIIVRYDRINFNPAKVVVYYQNERIGPARPVDLISNDRLNIDQLNNLKNNINNQ